ncbi:hypothetical protein CIB95_02535 [Lottiidibacillus patelloidae]|uniref:Uncharacterized protein n=1 Tax=Lottiidibacillus patelloidae TaxID=2670334 RepID=A0A263BXN1_9BACI|nr:hypothetical protein [Lottiidibacillus patelloidae]OZM58464.1 hypothetical protein CIB95_02535 [Lottiidibacillus patelloidae]
MKNKVQKKVTLTLEYFKNKVSKDKTVFSGGVVEPEISGLMIDVREGMHFDLESEQLVRNGKHELHIYGGRKDMMEFGKYLIALANYETEDPNYHDHFDNIKNFDGEDSVDIVIYQPKR